MWNRGSLLAEISRALRAHRPDDAEELLREVELRLAPGSGSRAPAVPRARLVDEIAPAVHAAFPDRADALLGDVAGAFWPRGVIGPVSALAPGEIEGDGVVDLEPESFPSFVLVSGPFPGMRLLLHRDSMRLGRGPDVDFRLPDDTLSRVHLRITLDARDQVFVEDTHGTSGTWVNGKPVYETWLADGDELRCGRVTLRFVAPAG